MQSNSLVMLICAVVGARVRVVGLKVVGLKVVVGLGLKVVRTQVLHFTGHTVLYPMTLRPRPEHSPESISAHNDASTCPSHPSLVVDAVEVATVGLEVMVEVVGIVEM
jgi:hypothetical protein